MSIEINYNTKKWTKTKLIEIITKLEKEVSDLTRYNKGKSNQCSELIVKKRDLEKLLTTALEPKFLCIAKSEIQISNENLDQVGNHTKQKIIGVGTKWIFNKSEAERLKSFGSVDILYEVSPENFLSKLEEIKSNSIKDFDSFKKINDDLYRNVNCLEKELEEAKKLEEKNRDLQQENNKLVNLLNHLTSNNTILETENKQLTQDVLKLVRKS